MAGLDVAVKGKVPAVPAVKVTVPVPSVAVNVSNVGFCVPVAWSLVGQCLSLCWGAGGSRYHRRIAWSQCGGWQGLNGLLHLYRDSCLYICL